MERIIVTTDFSTNSKSGIRFAIKLAKVRKARLIFLHIQTLLRASFWSDEEYAYYLEKDKSNLLAEMNSFVNNIYRSVNEKPVNYELVIFPKLDTIQGIIEYSKQCEASYICISTRGAGKLKRIIGTSTSGLIAKSQIPVISVPHTYRLKPIKRILYASDMKNYEAELEKVVAFARPLKSSIDMLHLLSFYPLFVSENMIVKDLEKKMNYKLSIHFQERNIEESLSQELASSLTRYKPDVLVMFTHQHRSLFEKIFLGSQTKKYSFQLKIPLLSCNKIEPAPKTSDVLHTTKN